MRSLSASCIRCWTSLRSVLLLSAACYLFLFVVAASGDHNYTHLLASALGSHRKIVGEHIDVVYLFVNGSDPTQQRIVANVSSSASGKEAMNLGRFRDWDELRYSFRSLFHNLAWFRYVFIVVSNNSTQVPSWLSTSRLGGRVKIVTHAQIFPDHRDLPTASSRSIEAHVHRVPGVSKRFILMNDDFFINRPVAKSFFVSSPTTHYVCLNAATTPDAAQPLKNPSARDQSVQLVNELLDSRYGKHPRRADCHAPQVIDVELMQKLQNEFPKEFLDASRSKSRSGKTIAVRYLYNQWLLDSQPDFKVVSKLWALRNALSFGLTQSMLKNRFYFFLVRVLQPLFVATNDDVDDSATNQEQIAKAFRGFCEKNYPWKSPVEIH